jgi:hypothetical protein
MTFWNLSCTAGRRQKYDECKWVITWIDWFREVQVITNVIVTSNQIKFEVKNVKVWDDCDLDPITIDLTECPTEY